MKNHHPGGLGPGILSAAGAYIIWGVLPIYWKTLSSVPALEILAHRVIWSFAFLAVLLAATGKLAATRREVAAIAADRRRLAGVVAAALLVTFNWLVYIWAVNASRIVETSLGYYINPLVSVLLGIVILGERLSSWQKAAVALAAAGVLNLTVSVAAFPWVTVTLAVTFGLYGLCKKLLGIGAITGIALETLIVSPVALLYLAWRHAGDGGAFTPAEPATALLLLGSGVVSAVPMVLFANGANRLPLTILGFVQFLSPTLALLVGVFLYGEAFTAAHLASFGCIWLALAVFMAAETKARTAAQPAAANSKRDLPSR